MNEPMNERCCFCARALCSALLCTQNPYDFQLDVLKKERKKKKRQPNTSTHEITKWNKWGSAVRACSYQWFFRPTPTASIGDNVKLIKYLLCVVCSRWRTKQWFCFIIHLSDEVCIVLFWFLPIVFVVVVFFCYLFCVSSLFGSVSIHELNDSFEGIDWLALHKLHFYWSLTIWYSISMAHIAMIFNWTFWNCVWRMWASASHLNWWCFVRQCTEMDMGWLIDRENRCVQWPELGFRDKSVIRFVSW